MNVHVINAVRAIANRCDGAVERDYIGFDGTDTHFGKNLAMIQDDEWTDAMIYDAWIMLKKYKVQLLRDHGIDYDSIPIVASVNESGRDQARSATRRERKRQGRKLTLINGSFAVSFPYDPTIVNEIKVIQPGDRQWEPGDKVWFVNVRANKHLREIVKNYDFVVSEDAQEMLDREFDNVLQMPQKLPEIVSRPSGILKMYTVNNKDTFVFEFPYNPDMVRDIKAAVPGRKWDPDRKHWTAPEESIEEIYEFACRWELDTSNALRERMRNAAINARDMRQASHAGESDLHIPGLGGELRPFQRAGVRYISRARRTFLADQMGLGKTIQAIASLEYEDAFPAVIICPASIKIQWQKECNKWIPDRNVEVLVGKYDGEGIPGVASGPGLKGYAFADIYILNYDIVAAYGKDTVGWVDAFLDDDDFKPKALILDESHFVKNMKAKRTLAITALSTKIKEDGLIVGMTGTPILNRPAELISQLAVMDRLKEFGGHKKFRSRYCWDEESFSYTGAINIDELNKKLRSICYIRRTKDQVMKELPDKARYFLHMEGSDREMDEYRKAETNFKEYLKEQAQELADSMMISLSSVMYTSEWRSKEAQHLTKIGLLRQLSAKAKLDFVIEWVQGMADSSNKVVVFAHHREIVLKLMKALDAPYIIGGSKQNDRTAAVEAFRGNSPVIILSIKAAGMGLDGLQVAQDVLFVEQDWTPAVLEQAEDRVHRMGQENAVSAWYAHIEGTIDDYIFGMLKRKSKIVDGVVEGKEQSIINAYLEEAMSS